MKYAFLTIEASLFIAMLMKIQDLRVYTIWRADLAQFKQKSKLYRRSASELEILGELAQRLHHEVTSSPIVDY